MVNTIDDARQLEDSIVKLLQEKSPRNVKRLSELLDVHAAYLSGFLDALVLKGTVELLEVGGSVKAYVLNSGHR